jgi:hypothetical protein
MKVASSPALQDLATTPWPSDLFRDSAGHIALAQLPDDVVDLTPYLLDDLNNVQDGFGVAGGAYFPVSSPIDPATLDGNVHLFDLESGDEFPVYTHFRSLDRPMPTIYARPANGGALLEKHQYAWVVTNKVHGPGGHLNPSADLAGILAHHTAATGTLAQAWNIYKPLLDLLDKGPITRNDVAAATVFTTHSVTAPLVSMRAALDAAGPPKATITMIFAKTTGAGVDDTLDNLLGMPAVNQGGYDNPGGIAHDHIGWVVQGRIPSIDFLNAQSPLNSLGVTTTSVDTFTNDAMPQMKATSTIPFTLVIPDLGTDPSKYVNLPVVIWQHGLNGDRSSMMAVADAPCASGMAVLGIDIPFHGERQPTAADVKRRFSSVMKPDDWVDDEGSPFLPFFDAMGNQKQKIPSFMPQALRSSFRQAALDMMQESRLVTAGDVSAIGAKDARLQQLSLRRDAIGYSGESFGAIIGTLACAIEPAIGAAFLDVGGGGLLFPLLLNSADFGPQIGPFLDGAFGTQTSGVPDPPDTDFAYNLMASLIDQADPSAYAPYVVLHPLDGRQPKHVLQPSAHLDETVPNQANENLARAMGLVPVALPAGGTPDMQYWPSAPAMLQAGVSGNLTVGGKPITAAFIQFEPATHGMMDGRKGQRTVDLSQPYPYPKLPAPVPIDNPIDRVLTIYASWFTDYFAGRVPAVVSGQ